jgi:hypothetical protein
MVAEEMQLDPVHIHLTIPIVYEQADVDALRAALSPSFEVHGGLYHRFGTAPALAILIAFVVGQLAGVPSNLLASVLYDGLKRMRMKRLRKSHDDPGPFPSLVIAIKTDPDATPHYFAEFRPSDEENLRAALASLAQIPTPEPGSPYYEYDPMTRERKQGW